jgi:hypothetical protein
MTAARGKQSGGIYGHCLNTGFMNATDPRDKVFSFIGVCPEAQARLTTVDYGHTGANVYTQATFASISGSGTFAIWDSIETQGTSTIGLPTWPLAFSRQHSRRDWSLKSNMLALDRSIAHNASISTCLSRLQINGYTVRQGQADDSQVYYVPSRRRLGRSESIRSFKQEGVRKTPFGTVITRQLQVGASNSRFPNATEAGERAYESDGKLCLLFNWWQAHLGLACRPIVSSYHDHLFESGHPGSVRNNFIK